MHAAQHHRTRPQATRRRRLLLAVVAAAALVGSILATEDPIPAAAWVQKEIDCRPYPATATYAVEMDDVPVAYGPSLRSAISAWNAWSSVTGISVRAVNRPVPAGSIPVNVIPVDSDPDARETFATMSLSCSSATGPSNGTLRIIRDKLGDQTERLRQNVFTHELGHLFGLAHAEDYLACSTVMQPTISPSSQCSNQFGPYPDDIAGVLARWKPNLTPHFPANSRIGRENYSPFRSLTSSAASTSGWLNPSKFTIPNTSGYSDWTYVPDRAGWGWVVNSGSGLCLRRRSASRLAMDYCKGDDTKWAVSRTNLVPGLDLTQLRSKTGRDCLAGRGSDSSPGWAFAARTMQCDTWAYQEDDSTSLLISPSTSTRTKRSIPDELAPGDPIVGVGSQRCVTVTGAARTVGAGLSLRTCDETAEQKWDLTPVSEGYVLGVYLPTGDYSGDSAQYRSPELCAQGSGSSVALATCDLTPSQTWTLAANGTIRNTGTGTCLNVDRATTANGSPLILYPCGTASNELWSFPEELRKSVMSLASVAGSNGASLGTGSAPAGDSDQRTRGVVTTDIGAAKARWAFEDVPGTGGGLLRNGDTGYCLRWKATSQQTVLDEACNGDDSSYRWGPTRLPNGAWKIQSQYTGECLDLSGGSTSAGTKVLTWSCNGSTNQQWRSVPNPLPEEPSVTVNRLPANAAMFGKATQSSTYNELGGPSNAIDGNPDGTYANGSVTHTMPEAGAWWQVDLGDNVPIDTVTLYNRTDCCGDRLADFWIMVSPTPFPTSGTPAQIAASPGVVATRVASTNGQNVAWAPGGSHRYVRVQLAGSNPLSLAEVSVTRRP